MVITWKNKVAALEMTQSGRETTGTIRLDISHRVSDVAPEEKRLAQDRLQEAASKYNPAKVEISGGQGHDYCYHTRATITLTSTQRAEAIRRRMRDAESVRCGCGDYGSWNQEDRISGTSGNESVVWAGCPNCHTQALGRPVLHTDLLWYEGRQR